MKKHASLPTNFLTFMTAVFLTNNYKPNDINIMTKTTIIKINKLITYIIFIFICFIILVRYIINSITKVRKIIIIFIININFIIIFNYIIINIINFWNTIIPNKSPLLTANLQQLEQICKFFKII